MPPARPLSCGIGRSISRSLTPHRLAGGGGGGDFACGARLDFNNTDTFVKIPLTFPDFPSAYRVKCKAFIRDAADFGTIFSHDTTRFRLLASGSKWVANGNAGQGTVTVGYHEIDYFIDASSKETLLIDGVPVFDAVSLSYGWSAIDYITFGCRTRNDTHITTSDYLNGTIFDVLINTAGADEVWTNAYAGRGNAPADWQDLIGSVDGVITGTGGVVYVNEQANTLTGTDPGCGGEPPFVYS